MWLKERYEDLRPLLLALLLTRLVNDDGLNDELLEWFALSSLLVLRRGGRRSMIDVRCGGC